MLAGALVLGPMTATLGAIAMFVVLTYATLLLGHSVGMHRFVIHRTYDSPKWVYRFLIYLGTVVGMAGPHGLIRIHDTRDWAQRLPRCHDFFSHRRRLHVDAFWQLHCRFEFAHPPRFDLEPEFRDDPWIRWMERTWMLQQVPIAFALFALGGWPWVVWGVFCRVAVSVAGHWIVTYYCHNPGPGRWSVVDAGVQAANLPSLGLLTMGECWHNNHHAFPESARMGLDPGETDPGYWVIEQMRDLGVAWNVRATRHAHDCDDLQEKHRDERASARLT
jgi:stearoyl-CoA desaturase (delta-9 desaturase)